MCLCCAILLERTDSRVPPHEPSTAAVSCQRSTASLAALVLSGGLTDQIQHPTTHLLSSLSCSSRLSPRRRAGRLSFSPSSDLTSPPLPLLSPSSPLWLCLPPLCGALVVAVPPAAAAPPTSSSEPLLLALPWPLSSLSLPLPAGVRSVGCWCVQRQDDKEDTTG